MADGRDKLIAKLAGLFVTLRGLFSVLYHLYQMTTGAIALNPLTGISLAVGAALFFSGLAVLTSSRKGYLFAVMMAFIELLLSVLSFNYIFILINLAILGAVKKGYDVEIKGTASGKKYSRTGKNY